MVSAVFVRQPDSLTGMHGQILPSNARSTSIGSGNGVSAIPTRNGRWISNVRQPSAGQTGSKRLTVWSSTSGMGTSVGSVTCRPTLMLRNGISGPLLTTSLLSWTAEITPITIFAALIDGAIPSVASDDDGNANEQACRTCHRRTPKPAWPRSRSSHRRRTRTGASQGRPTVATTTCLTKPIPCTSMGDAVVGSANVNGRSALARRYTRNSGWTLSSWQNITADLPNGQPRIPNDVGKSGRHLANANAFGLHNPLISEPLGSA